MWMSAVRAMLVVVAMISLAVPASATPTSLLSASDQGAAQKQKKTKKAKPAKPAKPSKPAVKAPQKPKESWELPMKFVIVRSGAANCEPLCPEWIMAEGKITDQSPGAFRKVLKRLGKRKLPVVISSPGGSMNAAIEIGRLIRRNKLDVAVGTTIYQGCAPFGAACELPKAQAGIYRGLASSIMAYCYSACPLVLAGGVNRIADALASVGVHEVRTDWTQERIVYRETYQIVKGKKKVISRKEVSRKPAKSYTTYGFDKRLRKSLTAYFKEMSISPDLLTDMGKAPHSSIYRLPLERQRELGLTTRVGSAQQFSGAGLCPVAVPAPSCVEREGFVPLKPIVSQSPENVPALGAVGIAFSDKPMAIAIVRNPAQGCEPFCPQWIAAQGVITADTPKLLAAILAKMGNEKLPIAFDSLGGDFDASLEIARMIRERGLQTIIVSTVFIGCSPETDCKPTSSSGFYKGYPLKSARCNGACLFAAMGGVALTSVRGTVSLHNPELYQSRADKRPAAVQLMLHFAKMGIAKDLLPRLQKITTGQTLTLDASQQAVFLRAVTDESSNAHLLKPIACKSAGPAWYCVKSKAAGQAKITPPVLPPSFRSGSQDRS